MTARRDFLVGSACVLGAGGAHCMTPRRHVSLLPPGVSIDRTIPRVFADWTSHDATNLVAPNQEGSLESRLYSESVGRVYTQDKSGAEVMMLVAYGTTQTNDLQLHRPELCYPAFGFSISHNASIDIGFDKGISLPSRRLVANAPDRMETIVYWSRLGEYFPSDRKEQQIDRLKTAIKGVISDGVLARFSVLNSDPSVALSVLLGFIPALVGAVEAHRRSVLIGSRRAAALMGLAA
jgi:EpsI family protein